MKNLFLSILCLGMVFPQVVWGQTDAEAQSYFYWRERGISSYHANQFEQAINEFKLARVLDDKPPLNDIEAWIDSAYGGYVKILDHARQMAEQERDRADSLRKNADLQSASNRILTQAILNRDTDPTLAIRLAEAAINKDPGNTVARDIFSDMLKNEQFYQQEFRHKDAINSISISRDSKYILTGSDDETAVLWDVDGNEVVKFAESGHTSDIHATAFSPDGKYILTGSNDHTAILWNQKGEIAHQFTRHMQAVNAVGFSPNWQDEEKRFMLTAGSDGYIFLWQEDGSIQLTIDTKKGIKDVRMTQDGHYIIAAFAKGPCHIYDLKGNLIRQIGEKEGQVSTMEISSDGKALAMGYYDQKFSLYSLETGLKQSDFNGHGGYIVSIAFSPDGKYMATGTSQNNTYLWDHTGHILHNYQEYFFSVCFSPNSKYLLSGGVDYDWSTSVGNENVVKLWDLEGNVIQAFEGHNDYVVSVAFLPNQMANAAWGTDSLYVLSGSNDNTARVWNLEGEEVLRLGGSGEISSVEGAVLSSDGKQVITWGYDGVLLWQWSGDADQPPTWKYLIGDSEIYNIQSLSLSSNNKKILIVGGSDGFEIWDMNGNRVNQRWRENTRFETAVFSADNTYILTGETSRKTGPNVTNLPGSATLWDTAGNQIQIFRGHRKTINAVAISPDNKYVATASDDSTAILWDINGNRILTFNGHQGRIKRVTFFPDGKSLITGSLDGTAVHWDLTGKILRTFNGEMFDFEQLQVAPNGEFLISSYDFSNTARSWPLHDWTPVEWPGPDKGIDISFAAFSPHGKYIVTGDKQGYIRFCDLTGQEVYSFQHIGEEIRQFAFSPHWKKDQLMLLLEGYGWVNHMKVNVKRKQANLVRTLLDKTRGVTWSIAYGPDGQEILTGDDAIALWNLQGEAQKSIFSARAKILAPIYSANGNLILTYLSGGKAGIWDKEKTPDYLDLLASDTLETLKSLNAALEQSKPMLRIDGLSTSSKCRPVAFWPGDQSILTGQVDHSVKRWDLNGELIALYMGLSDEVTAVAVSPEGGFVLGGSKNGDIALWDSTGQLVFMLNGHIAGVRSVEFSPLWGKGEHDYMLSVSLDGSVNLMDKQGKLIHAFGGSTRLQTYVSPHTFNADISVGWDPDSGGWVLAGTMYKHAQLWNPVSGETHDLIGHQQVITAVALSADNHLAVTGSQDQTARLWDVRPGKDFGRNMAVLTGHQGRIYSVAISPDKTRILTAGKDRVIKLWDQNGKLIRNFRGHNATVLCLDFSPDGAYILSGSADSTAMIWDKDGKIVQVFKGHSGPVNAATFSPDGRFILTAGEGDKGKLWDKNQNLIQTFDFGVLVRRVAFSPDGTRIIAEGESGQTRMWDIHGKELFNFGLRSNAAVSFSDDGERVLGATKENVMWAGYTLKGFLNKWVKPLSQAQKQEYGIAE